MANHKWKYNPEVGELQCTKCGIHKMKDQWSGETVYIDFSKDTYTQSISRSTTKRPDCIVKEIQVKMELTSKQKAEELVKNTQIAYLQN